MKHKTFINSLRHVAIFLAAIGLMGTAQSVLAQKGGTKQPSIVASPDYLCDSDFTGDQLNDIVFLNAASGMWTIHDSNNTMSYVRMGASNNKPVAADYDGDEIVDLASVSTDDGVMTWHILQSSEGREIQIVWGLEGDTLVPGDYDGDGKADVAVRRPFDNLWHINGSLGIEMTVECGIASDVAVPGDYDGDGLTDPATFRSSERTLYYFGSADHTMHEFTWDGLLTNASETFVPADYDGDGITDFAIFYARGGTWSIRESSTGEYRVEVFPIGPSPKGGMVIQPWGPGDYPFPADYDNDGKTDPAVWNPTLSNVRAIGSTSGPVEFVTETSDGMLPVSAFFTAK